MNTRITETPTDSPIGKIATHESTAAGKTLLHHTRRRRSCRPPHSLSILRKPSWRETSNKPPCRTRPFTTNSLCSGDKIGCLTAVLARGPMQNVSCWRHNHCNWTRDLSRCYDYRCRILSKAHLRASILYRYPLPRLNSNQVSIKHWRRPQYYERILYPDNVVQSHQKPEHSAPSHCNDEAHSSFGVFTATPSYPFTGYLSLIWNRPQPRK